LLINLLPAVDHMKNLFLLLYLICCSGNAGAQQLVNSRADDLERKLKGSQRYTDSAKVMMELSNYWAYTDSAKSMSYARQLMGLYQHHKDRQGIGVAHYYIAGVYMDAGKNEIAKAYFYKARAILEKDTAYNAQHYLARVWHNIGALLQREGDSKGYVDILLNKAVPILEAINDTVTLARNYSDIGQIFVNTNQFDKSLSWYKKAIKTLQHYSGYEDLALAYLGAARSILFKGDFSKVPAQQIKSYLDQAASVLKPNPKAPAWIEYFMNMGLYRIEVGNDPQGAIKNYDQGLALASQLNDDYLQLELLNRKYYLYDKQKQYALARATAYRLYALVSRYPISKNKLVVLKNLVDAEEHNGNSAKAFELLKQYTKLADSLKVEDTNLQLNELEKKYEQQKKRKRDYPPAK